MSTKSPFSERERKVIELLLQGKGNKQIALTLGVSARTIEFHLSNIYKKLDVSSRTEAALKLAEERLRESTGSPENNNLRKSTVENIKDTAENDGNFVQLWRQNMKSVVYILISGTLLVLVVWISLLTRGAPNYPALADQTSTDSAIELAALTEVVEATATEISPTKSTSLSYEFISPTKIKKDQMTFEILAELMTCEQVQLEVVGTFPLDFPLSYPESNYPSIVTEVKLISSSPDILLELDPSFGGGGGADVNDLHIRGQGFAYFINPPLTSGQTVQITALVKFNDFVGIPETVPFDLDLISDVCT